jgi:hypothetical protein
MRRRRVPPSHHEAQLFGIRLAGPLLAGYLPLVEHEDAIRERQHLVADLGALRTRVAGRQPAPA